ncbi:DUF4136 domain-containing protein [Kordiimonas sp. SCSIO 12610]|uniref:DUF4136 domain-containing protein n=1 Tax=Kordiimonas sp. SCSIO 12610 TaxID=2829597 RepID=UPI00210E2D23|nr:DUF4136 domain-containing protein [Kordiimonas sp. SCSIO 12610]UTW55517.1 DUF4136 domain-containing protein [Kordiimonas sp. SCSIO 12610]
MLKKVFVLSAVILLSACASKFKSDVATFHALPAPQGEKLALIPMLEEKQDSLEFAQYASVIGNHLESQGYREAGDSEPDLIVGFDVTIDDGREKLITRPGPYGFYGGFPYWAGYSRFGYWGFHRAGFRRGFIRPGFGFGGFGGFGRFGGFGGFGGFAGDQVIARTVYKATLTMEVRTKDGEKLFEGRAETETRKKDLPTTLPLLAEALFADFPGQSGVTRKVVLEPKKEG